MADFGDIIGNNQIKEHMKRAVKTGKVSHAYIIDGPLSSGKLMLAKAFAQMLQCENPMENGPCHNCHSCRQIQNGNSPDVIFVEHEKTAIIGVEDVRSQINTDIIIRPYDSKYKIYIIDEAEKMNVQAQNAILKTIEEPPEYAIIMLLTTNGMGFLPTILSRCVRLEMKPVDRDVIVDYLLKNRLCDADYRAKEVAAFSMGAVGRAINLASSEEFNQLKDSAVDTMKHIYELDMAQISAKIKEIMDYEERLDEYLDIMMIWYRDILMYKTTMDVGLLVFQNQVYDIKRRADRSSYNDLKKCLGFIDEARLRLSSNVNKEMTIELMLLNIKEN